MYDKFWDDLAHKISHDILVNTNQRTERIKICEQCDDLKAYFCTHCHCFMPVKTWVARAHCPVEKWKSINIDPS